MKKNNHTVTAIRRYRALEESVRDYVLIWLEHGRDLELAQADLAQEGGHKEAARRLRTQADAFKKTLAALRALVR